MASVRVAGLVVDTGSRKRHRRNRPYTNTARRRHGRQDITVSNEWFAISIAVDTAPPWGVARGGILDIALIDNGKVGYDIASLVDFMPNQWSSWPTSYQHVSVEQTDDQAGAHSNAARLGRRRAGYHVRD